MIVHHGKSGKMNLFENEFVGKTVFVTGNTGFMGTWLSLWLSNLGSKVVGYSKELSTKNYIINSLLKENKIHQILDDVNNLESITACISKYKPDYVFHLAAQSLVRESYEQPILTFQTNIMGTINVLEAIRNFSFIKSCIVVTSDKCYDNKEIEYAYKETDPLGGYDPYSASKGATELVTASYRNSFFLSGDKPFTPISTARAGNIIGGGDWANHRIIPDCINALIENKPIQVRNPNSIRPWQFVLESISGLLLLSQKMKNNPNQFASSWNFGPNTSSKMISVQNLVQLIISEWGKGDWSDISKDSKQLPHEAKYLMLDSNKSKNNLGWNTIYSIEEAIHETVNWYKENSIRPQNMYEFSLKQINNYVRKAQKMNMSWVS